MKELEIQTFKEKIAIFSSQKLCEIIISSRYLGSMTEQAIIAMEELSYRRNQGDQFDYENFIENEFKKLPNFKINVKEKFQIGIFDLSKIKL